jgi:hypothetical protein
MPSKRLNRRAVLRGALATGAAVAVPLPIFDGMLNDSGTAFAAGTPLPRRYCTWFFGNGILPPRWNPTSTGPDWMLSEELQPLSRVKNWLTVVSGLKRLIPNDSPHPGGSAAATTGAPVQSNSASAPSIDQIVAAVNPGGDFTSLEVGCSNATPNGPENTLHAVSHRGQNAPNYPEFDPQALFTRVFAGRADTGTMDQTAKLNQAKKSILDAVLRDSAEIQGVLGAKDRMRLDEHLTAIRQIEMRISSMPTRPAITLPQDPRTRGIGKDTRSEAPLAVNEVMAEMLAVALAADITRNSSFVFTLPAAHVFYRSLGTDMNDDFHDTICHTDPGDNASQTRVHRGVVYAMQALAYFLEKLASYTEGSGNVLDSSLVYVTSCTAWGKIHDVVEWPVLFAGKAGGALAGNRHYRAPGRNLTDALFTIAKIFGSTVPSVGKGPGLSSSELPDLRV